MGLGRDYLCFLCQFAASVAGDIFLSCRIDVDNHLSNNVLRIDGGLGSRSFGKDGCGLGFRLGAMGLQWDLWLGFSSVEGGGDVVGEWLLVGFHGDRQLCLARKHINEME